MERSSRNENLHSSFFLVILQRSSQPTHSTESASHLLILQTEIIPKRFMRSWLNSDPITRKKGENDMNNIIYLIGLVVVVLFVLSYFGLR